MVSIQTTFAADVLALAVAAAAPLDGSKVGLFTNNDLEVGKADCVLADFTQPTFAGYALATPTAFTIGTGDGGDKFAQSTPTTFTSTDAAGFPTTIQGYFVTAADGTTIQAWGYFPAKPQLLTAGQAVTINAIVPFGSQQQESGVAMVV